MSKESIKQEIIELVSELFKDQDVDIELIEYVDLSDDLGMDSLTFMTILVEVEDRFKITIPDEMLLIENFKCVDDIVNIVNTELEKEHGISEVTNNV